MPAGFELNQKQVSLNTFSPQTTLLEYLRKRGYVGTKEGCGDGDCGACTVVIIGKDANHAPQYQSVNSCLVPLGSIIDRKVLTVEGISKPSHPNQAMNELPLHPVQNAMVETGGSQCGYCTPGFIMSMFAGYYSGSLGDLSIEGNLCRCTGYLPIREAMQNLGNHKPNNDVFVDYLNNSSFTIGNGAQTFFTPKTLDDLFDIWQEHPQASLIAGGTDLGLELSHKSRQFEGLISLEYIDELKGIQETAESVVIGAATPLSWIEENLKGVFPVLDEMLHWFAARQIRNRATLGGNLGTASPIGDLSPVLLALDARLKLKTRKGERTVSTEDFFTDYRQTVLGDQELIASIILPKPTATQLSQTYKIAKRGTDDISIVAAVYRIDLDETNIIQTARLAYGGVAATPIRAKNVEQMLLGQPWTLQTVQNAKAVLMQSFSPLDDQRGSANYRHKLIGNLLEKFFFETQANEARDKVDV